MNRVIQSTILTVILAFAAVACSGTESANTTRLQPTQAVDGTTMEFTDLNLDFPPPSEMAGRVTSLDDDWLKPGAAYEEELPFANVEIEDTSLLYRVVDEANPGDYHSAHAFYAFQIVNTPVSTELKLIWHDYPGHLPCWVGLPIIETDEWDWVPLPANCTIPLDDCSKYMSSEMPLTVGVVLSGRENQLLDWIRLGDNAPPEADLSATPSSGESPLKVLLDASESTDSDGNIVRYDWDFDGDGVTDSRSYTQSWTEYTYETPGTYEAIVTVYDDAGDKDSASVAIAVKPSTNLPPVAMISADPLTGVAPLTVEFDATGSFDEDGEIIRYDWDFDGDRVTDYSSSESPLASHLYEEGGHFRATVTVVDDGGRTGSAGVVLDIAPRPLVGPEAEVTAAPITGDTPLEVLYDASGSTDSDGEIVRYDWDFDGDGTVDYSDETSPFAGHLFTVDGRYNSTVTVTDDDGLTDTATVAVRAGQWAHTWGGSSDDAFEDLCEDKDGNLYVGGDTYTPRGVDCLVQKFSETGDLLWSRSWNADIAEYVHGIAADSQGDVWACGVVTHPDKRDVDVLLLKFSSTGDLQLSQAWRGEGIDFAQNVVIDSADNVYVIASHEVLTGNMLDDHRDLLILKYDSAGNLLWARTWGGTETEKPLTAQLIDNGQLAICGGIGDAPSSETGRAFVLMLNADGSVAWSKTYRFEGNSSTVSGFTVGPHGEMYITGICRLIVDPGYGEDGSDLFVMKFSPSGDPLWTRLWNTDDSESGVSCAVGGDGMLYVSGRTYAYYPIRCFSTLLAMTPDGNLIWAREKTQDETHFPMSHLISKPGQTLYMIGIAEDNQIGGWDLLAENEDYALRMGNAEVTVLDTQSVEVEGSEWMPIGESLEPEGVLDTGGGYMDALISTFY